MTRIPRILHYVFGLTPDFGGKPWSLVHYVCVKSAIRWIKPEAITLYYEHEPTGPWWALTRPLLTPVKIAAPDEIFGNPLQHFAHRADVVRLHKLMEQGGIYLDVDVLVQRGFDDLLDHPMVLGREGDVGLCNAVILAEPRARFVERWLETYQLFRSTGFDVFWNEHSVKIPAWLAGRHPEDIEVLSPRAFFWPVWSPEDLSLIFESNAPVPMEETYANHLWQSLSWRYLEGLSPGVVRGRDTNFHRWIAPYVADLPDDFGASLG
jgi:hypothetical protein